MVLLFAVQLDQKIADRFIVVFVIMFELYFHNTFSLIFTLSYTQKSLIVFRFILANKFSPVNAETDQFRV